VLARAPAAAQDRLIAGLTLIGAAARRSLARDLSRLVEAMALPAQPPPMFFETPARRAKRGHRDKAV
jgi:hypothetical protein